MNTRFSIPTLTHVPYFPTLRFAPTNSSPAFWSRRTENIRLEENLPPASRGGRTPDAPLIYAVDDMPCLTELYTLVLKAAGYSVKAFNDRAEALAALNADIEKPDLLITDYRNTSIPVERFMRECLMLHPTLRILMASGLAPTHIRLFQIRPNRFIQKPFTPHELVQEVERALATKTV